MEDCFEDWCFVDPSIPEDDLCQARRKRIRTEPWIGSVHFPKFPGPSEEAPSLDISPMQVRTTIAKVREKIGEGSLMSDQMINPCAQEAENWPQMMQDIEQERSRLEEICWFEREVTQRMAVTRQNLGKMDAESLKELAASRSMSVHSTEARLLTDRDFKEDDIFGR